MGQRAADLLMSGMNMLQRTITLDPVRAVPARLRRLFLAGSALTLVLGCPANAEDLPTGGTVAAGDATISQTASKMVINQSTNKAVINWNTFDIGSGASVNFVLPDSGSVTLNRVTSDDASKIFGSLTSNGQIFLLNPRGIVFGVGSRINAAGLVASTLTLSDEDFQAGRYDFKSNGIKGAVVNQGEIVVNGYAALLAPTIRNEGIVFAQMGTVALAGGQGVTLDVTGNNLISVQVNPALVDQLIENRGLIAAPDGRVIDVVDGELDGLVGRSAVAVCGLHIQVPFAHLFIFGGTAQLA
jgi:filamentous hemagglutinin family protein